MSYNFDYGDPSDPQDPYYDDQSQDDPYSGDSGDDSPMDTQEFDQSNDSVGGGALSAYSPEDRAASEKRLSMLDTQYGAVQKQTSALYQKQQEILDRAMQRLMGAPAGPSKGEIYLNLAAAMGAPTKTGTFGETLSNVTGTGADLMKQRRQGDQVRQQLVDKYGIDATNATLGHLNAESRQLITQAEAERRRLFTMGRATSGRGSGLLAGFTIDEATGKYRSPNGQLYTPEQYMALTHPQRARAATPAGGPIGETGTDDPHEYARLVANYDAAPPTSRSLKAMGFNTLDEFYKEVRKHNPEYSAQNYVTSQRGLNAFSTGKQGDTVRSFNVTTDHLDTYRNAAEALKNGNIPAFNELALKIAEMTGEPAPTGFDATKNIVSSEVTKAVIGGQMAQADREEFAKAIKRSQSPAQMLEVFNRYGSLMGGQLRGLKKQYEGSTLRHDFEERWLEGPAKKWLYIQPDGSFKPPPARDTSKRLSPMGAGTPAPASGKPAAVFKTDAEAEAGIKKLQPGDAFIGPDGKLYRKKGAK